MHLIFILALIHGGLAYGLPLDLLGSRGPEISMGECPKKIVSYRLKDVVQFLVPNRYQLQRTLSKLVEILLEGTGEAELTEGRQHLQERIAANLANPLSNHLVLNLEAANVSLGIEQTPTHFILSLSTENPRQAKHFRTLLPKYFGFPFLPLPHTVAVPREFLKDHEESLEPIFDLLRDLSGARFVGGSFNAWAEQTERQLKRQVLAAFFASRERLASENHHPFDPSVARSITHALQLTKPESGLSRRWVSVDRLSELVENIDRLDIDGSAKMRITSALENNVRLHWNPADRFLLGSMVLPLARGRRAPIRLGIDFIFSGNFSARGDVILTLGIPAGYPIPMVDRVSFFVEAVPDPAGRLAKDDEIETEARTLFRKVKERSRHSH
jgi:hypothetical protein